MKYFQKNKNFLLTLLFIGIFILIPCLNITKKTNSLEEEKVIKNIKNNTTVKTLLSLLNINQNAVSIKVYDQYNTLKSENSIVVTGDILKVIYPGNNQISYTLSIMGDANGDGSLNTQDLVQIRKHIVGWIDPATGESFEKIGVYYQSIDINQDGEIDTRDLVIARKQIVGIPTTEDNKEIVFEDDIFEDNAITFTATFEKNGADAISAEKIQCVSSTNGSCEITAANIITNRTIIGWSTNKNSTTAEIKAGEKITLTANKKYYAITKTTYTATFDNSNLDYLEYEKASCNVYNEETSCQIILPEFNKLGHFNSFWGVSKSVTSDLTGTTRDLKEFNQVGQPYKLTKNLTFYPNTNHFNYSTINSNYTKFRSINTGKTIKVGKTLFEFENGIPQNAIDNFISEMNKAYSYFPFLYNQGKVFIMTKNTYENYSIAYGLCHNMYIYYGGDSYFTIDLQYDNSKGEINVNAGLHELAHAWDDYHNYIMDKSEKGVYKIDTQRICAQTDFTELYNLLTPKLFVESDGQLISKIETFAAMFTNYYWHVLKIDDSEQYYALKSNEKLSETELLALKNFIEKYINLANNNYQ